MIGSILLNLYIQKALIFITIFCLYFVYIPSAISSFTKEQSLFKNISYIVLWNTIYISFKNSNLLLNVISLTLLFSSTISVLLQQFLFQTQSDHTFQLLCLRQQHLISCRIRNVLVDLRFLRNIDLSHRLPCAETIRHALCQISAGSSE